MGDGNWKLKQNKWRRSVEDVLRKASAVARHQGKLKKQEGRYARAIRALRADLQRENQKIRTRSKVLTSAESAMMLEVRKNKHRDMQEAAALEKKEDTRAVQRSRLTRRITLTLRALAGAGANLRKIVAKIVRERGRGKRMLAKVLSGLKHVRWLSQFRKHRAQESKRFRELVKQVVRSARRLRLEHNLIGDAGMKESHQLRKLEEKGKRCLIHAENSVKRYLRALETEHEHVLEVVTKSRNTAQRILELKAEASKYAKSGQRRHKRDAEKKGKEVVSFRTQHGRWQEKVQRKLQERNSMLKAQSLAGHDQNKLNSAARLLQKELLKSYAQGGRLMRELNHEKVVLERILEKEKKEQAHERIEVKSYNAAASKQREQVTSILGETRKERNIMSKHQGKWLENLGRLQATRKHIKIWASLARGKGTRLPKQIKYTKASVKSLKRRSNMNTQHLIGVHKENMRLFRKWKAEERQEQLRLSARIHSGRERLRREAGAMHGLKKTEKKLLLRFERKRRKTDVNLR